MIVPCYQAEVSPSHSARPTFDLTGPGATNMRAVCYREVRLPASSSQVSEPSKSANLLVG